MRLMPGVATGPIRLGGEATERIRSQMLERHGVRPVEARVPDAAPRIDGGSDHMCERAKPVSELAVPPGEQDHAVPVLSARSFDADRALGWDPRHAIHRSESRSWR